MDTDLTVDDEFHARQADAFVRQAGETECQFWVAHVHHDFGRCFWHRIQLQVDDFHFQFAIVYQACVAFGTRHGHHLAFF